MKKLFVFAAVFVLAFAAYGQRKTAQPLAVQKKPLTHDVYDGWKEITYKLLSPDGQLAAFTINPQDGDGKAVFYNLKTSTQDSIKRADNLSLSFDNQYAFFKIKPQQKLVKDLRRRKKKKEDLPKDSLGWYVINSRKIEKVPEVRSYKIPEKAGGWLAYQLEVTKEIKPKPDDKAKPDKKPGKKKINSEDNGYTLVVKKFAEGKTTTFGFVKDY